jgi:hypothetical protein
MHVEKFGENVLCLVLRMNLIIDIYIVTIIEDNHFRALPHRLVTEGKF